MGRPNLTLAAETGYIRYFLKRIIWKILTKFGRKTFRIPLPNNNILLAPSDSVFASDVFVTAGNVDWGAEWILERYLSTRTKGVVYDVGANIGYYSSALSNVATEIVMFDPDPRNRDSLNEISMKNPNCRFVPSAISDVSEVKAFYLGENSTVSHLASKKQSTASFIELRTTTIDDYHFSNISSEITAIKIDIEGHDLPALMGANKSIIQFHPLILMEFNIDDSSPNSFAQLDSFVRSINYEATAIVREKCWNGFLYRLENISNKLKNPKEDMKMIFLASSTDKIFKDLCTAIPKTWFCDSLSPIKSSPLLNHLFRQNPN